ncbi:unnamed protein product [Vicia faba]|uniref:Reverse transcriptase domain-containing protein n=1 Tax=Vicia faba TaxID=3906 RepID=A0AAV1AFT0_VICFA|nr:unnamed protein product [Vicia faba]
MANFKFKVITKILADMLASMMLELISLEQMGFIQGTQIKDCSCLASEVENSLHNKSFAGNIALKIDVTNTLTHLNGLSFSRFLGLLVLVKFFAIELRLFLDLQHCLSLSMDPCMAISNALEGSPSSSPSDHRNFFGAPLDIWVKVNADEATNNITSSYGGIFRISSGDFIVRFSKNLGLHNAFFAETFRALRAIEGD